MQPRIVSKVVNTDTGVETELAPVKVRQVISESTSSKIKSMMESVVTTGTGTTNWRGVILKRCPKDIVASSTSWQLSLLTKILFASPDILTPVETDTPGDFYCNKVYKVANYDINCWADNAHGALSLRKAVEKSCNPSFIQLGHISIRRSHNYYTTTSSLIF